MLALNSKTKINPSIFNREELSLISGHSPFRFYDLDAEIYGVNSVGLITSILWLSSQECKRCGGTGEVECCECGNENECGECEGEGKAQSNRLFVTQCDGITIIRVFDPYETRLMVESGDPALDDIIVLKDAWDQC